MGGWPVPPRFFEVGAAFGFSGAQDWIEEVDEESPGTREWSRLGRTGQGRKGATVR